MRRQNISKTALVSLFDCVRSDTDGDASKPTIAVMEWCCSFPRIPQSFPSHDNLMEPTIKIRIAGLGHKVTLRDIPASTTTVDELRTKVCEATGLPPRFQNLIGPQRLSINCFDEEDDRYDATLGSKTLAELGIKDRTKLMLLHSPLYSIEKDTYEQLRRVEDEINELERSIRSNARDTQKPGFVSEMITRFCCRLDVIDVAGSKALRAQRKALIQKAEGLETIKPGEC
eukprot:jgi/Psemu1/323170/estExt_fgenesh1_pg.C_590018